MASLNATAEAARVDSARIRHESESLKLRVRGNLARSRQGLGKAQHEAGRARARRVEALPSPWSELHWTHAHETLERTLVPLASR